MSERTGYPPGTFCWTDLGTTDAESRKDFYTRLFGWDYEDRPTDSGPYTTFTIDGKPVCALYEQSGDRLAAGWSPTWLSYVSVEDADAAARSAAELGGEVLSDPFDVMDAGRMALVADPTGAMFAMWQPGSHFGAALVNDPGTMTWNELTTNDPRATLDFYTQLFGWGVVPNPDPGAGDEYTVIRVGNRTNGGIRRIPEGRGAGPSWLVYFTTADIDRSVENADEHGGNVLVAPMKVPVSESRIAVVQDPQGAVFALFEGEIDD